MLDDGVAEEYADDDAPSGDEYVIADDAAEPHVAAPAAAPNDPGRHGCCSAEPTEHA